MLPDPPKPLVFRNTSLADLRNFPREVMREIGYQDHVQRDLEPVDWKPVSAVGPGVREIRVRDNNGAFRVLYVAKFEDATYVLHCFQKKTKQTNQHDIGLAKNRYSELLKELKS